MFKPKDDVMAFLDELCNMDRRSPEELKEGIIVDGSEYTYERVREVINAGEPLAEKLYGQIEVLHEATKVANPPPRYRRRLR